MLKLFFKLLNKTSWLILCSSSVLKVIYLRLMLSKVHHISKHGQSIMLSLSS